MKFQYVGTTKTRQRVKGVLEAMDRTEAQLRLRAQQIRPEKLEVFKGGATSKFSFSLGSPVSLKGLVIFTRQFSSLIDSGVPIVQTLRILAEQEGRKGFKQVLEQLCEDIESGGTLAEALGKHPRVFSPFYVRVVEAGEISGTLDTSLRRVGQQLEKLGRLKAKVIGALTYPCITVLVAIAVLIVMLVKVFPEITKLYGDKPLPDITMFVLSLSKFFQNYFGEIILSIILVTVGIIMAFRNQKVRKVIDPIIVKIPLVGTLILRSAVARFTRTLSALVASGVPLLTGFDICEKITSNWAVRDSIHRASNAVAEGRGIAAGLSESNVFPPMVVHMVGIGELSGRLDDLLGKIADIYDDEVDDAVSLMTDVLQPVLIVMVGGMVMFLLLAMYMPMFGMAEAAAGI